MDEKRNTQKRICEKDSQMIHEQTIGLVSEAMYLKRVNQQLIPVQIAINEDKKKAGKPFGSWLISIGESK